jgi:hypothetical protein
MEIEVATTTITKILTNNNHKNNNSREMFILRDKKLSYS